MGRWRSDALALSALTVFLGLALGNRLHFDTWLARFDLAAFFVPWYAFLGERLREFDVPGWNPHLFSGTPFAGDPESGWMYLPAMVSFALFPVTTGFKVMVGIHLMVAALSSYAFARVLGMRSIAALTSAVVFTFGPVLQWNTYCCLIFGQYAIWIPLALLGVELALRARRWRNRLVSWCVIGFAVSQMFAGWIGEGWLYIPMLIGAYVGYRALLSPSELDRSWRGRVVDAIMTGGAGLGIGTALGAAGIWPRLAANAQSHLAGGKYDELGVGWILNPPWELDYLLAQIMGMGTGYHFRAAGLGGAALVLSLLAPVVARTRFAVPFFAVLTLVALTLALDTTPLHHLFYLIPRYRALHEHDPWRTVSLATIGPAILSGAAVEALSRWRGRRRVLPIVVAPLLLMMITAAALGLIKGVIGWAPLIAAAAVTAAVAVIVAAPRDGSSRGRIGRAAQWATALIPVVAFLQPTGLELSGSWLGWPSDPRWERHWHPNPAVARALAVEVAGTDPTGAGGFLQAQLASSGPFRYVGYGGVAYPDDHQRRSSYMSRRFEPTVQAILVNGRSIFLSLYEIQGYNPLQLARYAEFMTAVNGMRQDYHVAYVRHTGVGSPLLDLLNVRYALVDATIPPTREDIVALTAGRREVFRTPYVVVYESLSPPPHAWIVHDVRAVERGEALPLLTDGSTDPYQTALVEGPLPAVAVLDESAEEWARVTHYEPDGLTIELSAASPGLLVISQVYEKGWRAYVDGERVDVLPTHHALQGVAIPAGEHTVELRYEPMALRMGLPISVITAVAMLAIFAAAGWEGLRSEARRGTSTRVGVFQDRPLPGREHGAHPRRDATSGSGT